MQEAREFRRDATVPTLPGGMDKLHVSLHFYILRLSFQAGQVATRLLLYHSY